MKITIEITKDMNCLCGNYEREIAQMLIEAFSNGKIIK